MYLESKDSVIHVMHDNARQQNAVIKCTYAWCVFACVCIYLGDRFSRGRPIPAGYKRPIDPTPPLTHALQSKRGTLPSLFNITANVCVHLTLSLQHTGKRRHEERWKNKWKEIVREKDREQGRGVTWIWREEGRKEGDGVNLQWKTTRNKI